MNQCGLGWIANQGLNSYGKKCSYLVVSDGTPAEIASGNTCEKNKYNYIR